MILMPDSVLSWQDTHKLLEAGEFASSVLSPWGSNYTFLATIRDGSRECRAVYKPKAGEVPLWDFPAGTLCKREYAAYLLSEILGWRFIPPTVLRDGPHGEGSVQLFVEHDPRITYFNIRKTHPDALRMIGCFDLVSNNADRKAIHCLLGNDGNIWGIDHGLTFNSVIKLRTVIWDHAGAPIPSTYLDSLAALLQDLDRPDGKASELVSLLDSDEVEALAVRISWLLETREYPEIRVRKRPGL